MVNSVFEKIKELEQEVFLLNKKNQLLEEKLTQDTNLNVTQFPSKDSKSGFLEKISILELQIKKLVEDKRHMLILINKSEEKTSVEKKMVRKYNSTLFPEVKNDIKEIEVDLKKENQDINERIKDIFSKFPEVKNDIKEIEVDLKKENQDINERIKDIFSNTKIPK